jgi:hypothetical protein
MANPNGRPLIGKSQSKHGFYNSGGVHKTWVNNVKTKPCQLWENMKSRIDYLPTVDEGKFGKYSLVEVCDDWKDFQLFAEWFSQMVVDGKYNQGWQLDKDILFKNNTMYSPETCAFLPEEVNKALNIKSRFRGELPVGMSRYKDKPHLIAVEYRCKNKDFCVRFNTTDSKIEESFLVYKRARESYIKHLANLYKNQLEERAYNALLSYEITLED